MFGLDPRTTLTLKATRSKAVHITEFLPDDVRKKRAPTKALRVETREDGEPCVLYNEMSISYSGITLDAWGAANTRLLNYLLQTGRVKHCDVEYYLAYTAHIFDLVERYQWVSILSFDQQYRELQAEHGFPWGTFAAQLELKTLVLKPATPVFSERVGQGQEECRMFKAKGACNFGAACRYRHVTIKRLANDAAGGSGTVPKN
jgi:hypothetical protein